MMRKMVLCLLLSGTLCMADTIILKDGSRHDGMLESSNNQYVVFSEDGMPHRYSRSEVREVEFNQAGMPSNTSNYNNDDRYRNDGQYSNNGQYNNGQYNNAPYDSGRNSANYGSNGRHAATVPAGTEIAVLTNETIDSQSANEGQLFPAEVQQDVVDQSGRVVIPKGSQAELTIRQVNPGGTTGSSELALGLDSVNVNGNTYRVSTDMCNNKGTRV
jgi:hypothetical protein